MSIITIPNILREKLTDEGANALVEILDRVEDRSQAHTIETVELKFEKRLTEETTRLEKRITEETTRLEIKIESARSDLEKKIESTRTDLIKWMFIFWIGQFASIVGILTAILFAFFK
ncbi:MAG: hypothetical protein E3K37_01580 [Candidatus Kuenenia sp.]|nr:hypothetical protein [Candidatus Kuenenia hertensis]